jgi:hypothetical protein
MTGDDSDEIPPIVPKLCETVIQMRGNLADAADELGLSYQYAYDLFCTYSEIKNAVRAGKYFYLDDLEKQLIFDATNKNVPPQIRALHLHYALGKLGVDRGWSTSHIAVQSPVVNIHRIAPNPQKMP